MITLPLEYNLDSKAKGLCERKQKTFFSLYLEAVSGNQIVASVKIVTVEYHLPTKKTCRRLDHHMKYGDEIADGIDVFS